MESASLYINSDNGNVGIGTRTPSYKLDVNGDSRLYQMVFTGSNSPFTNSAIIYTQADRHNFFGVDGQWSSKYFGMKTDGTFITMGGNVGIGATDTKGYKLAVNGSAIFTSVKVQLYPQWGDYVFDKDYNLMPLNAVAEYIKQNNHLPDMPSADEMRKTDGLDLGEINVKLLQKVEELTLHIIELNHKMNTFRMINLLQNRINIMF